MRQFDITEWGESINLFNKATGKKRWMIRYRVAYTDLIVANKTGSRRYYNFLLKTFFLFRNIIKVFSAAFFRKSFLWEGKKTVFLVSANVTYTQHVVPVAEQFYKDGKDIILLCESLDRKDVEKFITTRSNIPLHLLHDIETIGRKSINDYISWLWLPFQMVYSLIEFYSLKIPGYFWVFTSFTRFAFIKHYFENRAEEWLVSGTEMLISANDHWRWESMLHDIATQRNVPNYVIQHGLLNELFYPMVAHRFCAWGEYYKEEMVRKFEAKPEEIIVTGSVYLDNLYNLSNNQKNLKKKQYITFLSQPYTKSSMLLGDGSYQRLILWLNKILPIAEKYGYRLLIKLHPRDYEYYHSTVNCNEFSRKALSEVFSETELAITVDSAAIIEASFFDIPVIQLYEPQVRKYWDMSKEGLSIRVDSDEELCSTVEKLLGDASFRKAATDNIRNAYQRHFHSLGNSGNNIYSCLSQTSKQSVSV
jgi:hypothetical protein